LGGRRALEMADLKAVISEHRGRLEGREAGERRIAVGEPAWGIEGWRVTHRQAQDALTVALRRAPMLTCYREVALLACALKDKELGRALIEIYLTPLKDGRDGGPVLRQTLRAYLGAECNVSSAAKAMRVARSTVIKRLRTIEARLGRTLNPCPAELEVALALDELGVGMDTDDRIRGGFYLFDVTSRYFLMQSV
jgi:DNA-binding PucR family transcriptional regulator